MKKILITYLSLHLLCITAENTNSHPFFPAIAATADTLFNTGSIISFIPFIPYPPAKIITSAAIGTGLTATALFRAYTRQDSTEAPTKKLSIILRENQGIVDQKLQNSVCFSLLSLPVASVISYGLAKQQGISFCNIAKHTLPKGAKLAFMLSYAGFSAMGAALGNKLK